MSHDLPTIFGAGLFDSNERFPDLTVTNPRKVKKYELEYFFEDGGCAVINGEKHLLQAGHILLARPDDIRYSYLPFACKYVRFIATDAQQIAALESISSFCRVNESQKVEKLITQIIAHTYSPTPFDNMTAAAELITLLHLIQNDTKQEPTIVLKAQQFIETHCCDELSTEIIADACNISVSYLHKLFKTALNTTPGEYLLRCRISAARDLLINTDQSLNDIAYNCGFGSQSYFSCCFKKCVGVSPKDFRKSTG